MSCSFEEYTLIHDEIIKSFGRFINEMCSTDVILAWKM